MKKKMIINTLITIKDNDTNEKHYFHYGKKEVIRNGKTEIRRVTIGAIKRDGQLLFGRAECSIKDIFTKKKARIITLGRANKSPLEKVEINDSQIIGKIFVEVAKQLIN